MKGAPRKLRKSCSLPTCSKTPGECMHCTCDGRCGQHEGGHCGVRREGNGKSCKRDGCLRDDSCLHSTRATCCHCRNLVSSSNRSSRKRTRSAVSPVTADELLAVTAPAVLQKLPSSMVEGGDAGNAQDEDDDGATSPTSCDALVPVAPTDTFADFDLCDEILCKKRKLSEEQPQPMLPSSSSTTTVAAPPSPPPTTTTTTSTTDTPLKPLCEQDAYIARRATCNLIVLVDGVQFNLHKYPMLLESQVLNAKAREVVLSSKASVPVLQLNSFPGGPAVFDLLCVYAYTGHLHLDATTAAATLAGLHYLNMGLGAKTQTQTFISELMQSATTLDRLLQVTQHAAEIAETHDVAQPLLMDCIEAVARVLPLQLESIGSIITLSSELFLHITQEMLATRGTSEVVGDAVRQLCVQAELAQIQRDAGADATARVLALLTQSLATATPTVGRVEVPQGEGAAVDDDDDDALFMKMMYDDFELEPASDVDADGNFADVLALEPFAFVGPRAPRTLAQAFAV